MKPGFSLVGRTKVHLVVFVSSASMGDVLSPLFNLFHSGYRYTDTLANSIEPDEIPQIKTIFMEYRNPMLMKICRRYLKYNFILILLIWMS